MKELFNTVLYEPLYNALIFLIDIVPGGDLGWAVILLTVIVKFILFPLSIKAVRTQMKMKELQPEINEMRDKYKDKPEELGREMLEFYRKNELNPFSSIGVLLIQIPIILALYWVFYKGGFPAVDAEKIYSFMFVPETINVEFLGFMNITESKNLILAFGAAITQYIQARYMMPVIEPKKEGEKPSFQDDLARGMSVQMKYVLPVFIFIFSYTLIAVVALYWMVSNLFSIGQEMWVRRNVKKK